MLSSLIPELDKKKDLASFLFEIAYIFQLLLICFHCCDSQVEEVNSLATEVASVTLKEQAFLNECKDILSMLVAMQVNT